MNRKKRDYKARHNLIMNTAAVIIGVTILIILATIAANFL